MDIRCIVAHYEEDSDRLFHATVFDARLADFSLANAFLLGMDLARICTNQEAEIVRRFLKRFEDDENEFSKRLAALRKGLDR